MNEAKRRAYREKADAELRAWNARVDQLLAKAQAMKASGKIQFHDKMERLREQRSRVNDKFDELKETGGETWNEIRENFEKAHRELSSAFHATIDAFRESGEDEKDLPVAPPPVTRTDDTESAGR